MQEVSEGDKHSSLSPHALTEAKKVFTTAFAGVEKSLQLPLFLNPFIMFKTSLKTKYGLSERSANL